MTASDRDIVDYEFDIAPGRTIRGSVHLPAPDHRPAPVLLFCHGFKGFKDWGPWPWLATRLAASGYVVNRFNFSFGGVGASGDSHDEPEKFAVNTYGDEIDDIATVLDRRDQWCVPAGAMSGATGLIGHSRGGFVGLLAATERDDIAAVAALASPGRGRRHTDEQINEWRERGRFDVLNQRTGQVLTMDISILDDFFANEQRYDLTTRAKELASCGRETAPALLVHGDRDETVPIIEASWIREALTGPTRLVELSGADHTFLARHPYLEPSPHLERIATLCREFFDERLQA